MSSLIKIIEAPLKLLGTHNVECVIIGGVAATLHGSTLLTNDLDVCYARSEANLDKLARALQSVNARLRNAPAGLPFIPDTETLRRGLNFTFETDVGSLDLLGEVRGLGYYEDVVSGSPIHELFGFSFPVINIEKLILAKRAAGRPKDLIAIPELEALMEVTTQVQYCSMVESILRDLSKEFGIHGFQRFSPDIFAKNEYRPGDWTYECDNGYLITLRTWYDVGRSEETIQGPLPIVSLDQQVGLRDDLRNKVQMMLARPEAACFSDLSKIIS